MGVKTDAVISCVRAVASDVKFIIISCIVALTYVALFVVTHYCNDFLKEYTGDIVIGAALTSPILMLMMSFLIKNSIKNNESIQFAVMKGGDESIKKVDDMYAEVKKVLKRGDRVDVIYMHLENKVPGGLFDNQNKLIEYAKKEGFNLKFKVIVGDQDEDKKIFIEALRKSSCELFEPQVFYTTPFLNVLIIPQINQVYLGLGEWLGAGATGGVWIDNKHFCGAMQTMVERLERVCPGHFACVARG